ncbi:hypothetical protein HN446_00510 [bacterium]|jgi:hypothetical protein|nr:hypothetical protein [bacterium]
MKKIFLFISIVFFLGRGYMSAACCWNWCCDSRAEDYREEEKDDEVKEGGDVAVVPILVASYSVKLKRLFDQARARYLESFDVSFMGEGNQIFTSGRVMMAAGIELQKRLRGGAWLWLSGIERTAVWEPYNEFCAVVEARDPEGSLDGPVGCSAVIVDKDGQIKFLDNEIARTIFRLRPST